MGDLTQDEQVTSFWQLARFHARLNAAPSYFGPTTLESVPPPWWQWSTDAEEADAFVAAALATGGAEATAPLAAYDGELPEPGTLSILCDAAGHPRALLEVTEVEVGGDGLVERYRVVYAGD